MESQLSFISFTIMLFLLAGSAYMFYLLIGKTASFFWQNIVVFELYLFRFQEMCELSPLSTSAKVYGFVNFVVGVAAIIWCFIIYGENKATFFLRGFFHVGVHALHCLCVMTGLWMPHRGHPMLLVITRLPNELTTKFVIWTCAISANDSVWAQCQITNMWI